jgi:hypothetical protein
MSADTLCDILQVAHEFQMPHLVEVCCVLLSRKLSLLDNIKKSTCLAAVIATTVDAHGPSTNLWKLCVDFILGNLVEVLMDPSFASMATEHPDLWNRLRRADISPSRRQKRSREETIDS